METLLSSLRQQVIDLKTERLRLQSPQSTESESSSTGTSSLPPCSPKGSTLIIPSNAPAPNGNRDFFYFVGLEPELNADPKAVTPVASLEEATKRMRKLSARGRLLYGQVSHLKRVNHQLLRNRHPVAKRHGGHSRQVLQRAGGVYALSLFFASWLFLDAIPVRAAAGSGMACVPLAYDRGSEAFLWVVYLGVVAFLPLAGILYMAWDVFSHGFHRGLSGAKRELLNFFVLVLAVYLVMWLPSVVTMWMFDARMPGGNAFNFFGGLWSHLQGLVSAFLFLRKRDVLDAVRHLPLVGCAVGALVDCLPGFHPRLAGARPGATSANIDIYAGNDLHADDDGARWIMGMYPPEALELSEVRSKQDEAVSPPGTAQRDAPGAEDLACFPPQFPLRSGGGPVGKLCTLFAPRFADFYFEQRYRQHRDKGLDSVQLWFACVMVFYVVSLWVYYLADDDSYDRNVNMTLGSRELQVELSLPHAALFVAWVTWAMLHALPCARARGSELQAVQVSVLVALNCWGLPATAKEKCPTFNGNLQQTLFMLLCYAAVFCRISTDAFVMLCLVTVTNFIAARSAWKQLDTQPFALGFEAPKLIATLAMVGAGVRWTDLHLRREFAARELMLMVIEEQGRQMEAALKVAATIGREMEAAAR